MVQIARGGGGADVFIFDGLTGDPATNAYTPQTRIKDFEVGVDRLDISGEVANMFYSQRDDVTRLVLENGLKIILEDIKLADLHIDDLF